MPVSVGRFQSGFFAAELAANGYRGRVIRIVNDRIVSFLPHEVKIEFEEFAANSSSSMRLFEPDFVKLANIPLSVEESSQNFPFVFVPRISLPVFLCARFVPDRMSNNLAVVIDPNGELGRILSQSSLLLFTQLLGKTIRASPLRITSQFPVIHLELRKIAANYKPH